MLLFGPSAQVLYVGMPNMFKRTSAALLIALSSLGAFSCSGVPPTPEPDPNDTACDEDEKRCDGTCVGLSDPGYGCGSDSCTACNQRGSVIYGSERHGCSATGACELIECNFETSWKMDADCDGHIGNGCEISLLDDIRNCGACGNVCPEMSPPGATGTTCSLGACTPACLPGRSNADGVFENGCEATMPFVVGDYCPGEVPADGAFCDYLNVTSCDYYTPGSPCVTTAICTFGGIGDTDWFVQEESCLGRPTGEFCELDVECYSEKCVDHACLAPNGNSCGMDAECASGTCCPTQDANQYECTSSCLLLAVGEACTWNAACQTGNCVDGACGACLTADCTANICGARQCESIAGVDCGTCTGTDYCVSGTCFDACADGVCGMSHGVDCGGCTGTDYCAQGTCEDACADTECGLSHGVNCGGCTGTDYCTVDGTCEDACAGRECGGSHGVNCGACPGDTDYCTAYGQCTDACAERECGENQGVECGDCPEDEACDDGTCEPIICPVDQTYFCKDGDVWECTNGTVEELGDTCTEDEYCTENYVACRPYCAPAEPTCFEGKVGPCAADGKGLESVTRDCAAESLSCRPTLGCGHAYSDDFASSLCSDGWDFVGNVYEVTRDGYLWTFGMQFFLQSAANVTHSVYTAPSATGPFTRQAMLTEMVQPALGVVQAYATGFDLELQDGDFVLLAVSVDGGDAIVCRGASGTSEVGTFGTSTGTGYVLATDPGASIVTAPTAITSGTSVYTFLPD